MGWGSVDVECTPACTPTVRCPTPALRPRPSLATTYLYRTIGSYLLFEAARVSCVNMRRARPNQKTLFPQFKRTLIHTSVDCY